MDISMKNENGATTLEIEGRIDTTTAPKLDARVGEVISAADQLVFDLTNVEYISSAGLRIILQTHKSMSAKNGIFKIIGANEELMEIFEMTGFLDFLNIESR